MISKIDGIFIFGLDLGSYFQIRVRLRCSHIKSELIPILKDNWFGYNHNNFQI